MTIVVKTYYEQFNSFKPHELRVIDEKAELDKKISALQAFRKTKVCDGLPREERCRLGAQLTFMESYSVVLGMRIAAFTATTEEPV